MSYGVETHSSGHQYQLVVNHTPTEADVSFNITMSNANGDLSEVDRDLIFQYVLDALAGLEDMTFVEALKTGQFEASVTPS